MNFSRSYSLKRNEISDQIFENLSELKNFVKSLDSSIKVNISCSTPSMDLTTSESLNSSEGFDLIPNNSTTNTNNTKKLHLSRGFTSKELFNNKVHKPYEVKRHFSVKKHRPRLRKNKTKFLTEDNFLDEF
ncbi:hypothetical protein M0813_15835 [Anaeramoeba flamelloides]|uniref:Uncharacterized protein n=1 Tax=Anaeramoeba flamelloides TaxID=1746091 RepID=A0ABQ8Z294_9EUKA|nr:hypothetical protein M0813_15835 [Anaeramoeba flamelloides]